MPDLILADGGKAHVAAAQGVIRELGLDIPVAGMQKDKKHRTSALVREDGEVFDLTDDLLMLRFIAGIQNEAHRFAIEYNKLLRGKRYSKSGLDGITGIGPKKRLLLYKHFGSLPKIKEATLEQLTAVDGINTKDVKTIFDHFHVD